MSGIDLLKLLNADIAKQKKREKAKPETTRPVYRSGVTKIKEKINGQRYAVLQGTRVADHIHVFSRLEICHICHEESHTVQRITIIERDKEGNHYATTENDINSFAMLEFRRADLPIKFTTHDKIIPGCHACLTNLALGK